MSFLLIEVDWSGPSWYNRGMDGGAWRTKLASSSLPTRRVWLRQLCSGLLLASGTLFFLATVTCSARSLASLWPGEQGGYLLLGDVAPFVVPDRAWALATTPALPANVHPGPTPTPTPTPPPAPPVQIRIPAIGVTRSIVELPQTKDPKTGAWTLDVSVLFRSAGKDLVGHWAGSASPGQEGNMILVGHNYGYGTTGVFLKLGRLKAGQEVQIVDEAGETFVYRVRTVEHVPWRDKDLDELRQHAAFLAMDGPERLTLVTCGGANRAPFPERIYVVADPVPAE
jgi:LPXTG-site transpeptidase (sortase) family protein